MSKTADLAVVGAGAAGLMTAIQAARSNPRLSILLLDSRQKIGAKILVSGGTRCNVTNVRVTPQDYEGGASHFVKHVLEAFTPAQTMAFFKEIGVELVLEPTGKYFPSTHSGKTVLDALVKEAEQRGVVLKTGARITAIRKKGDGFVLESDGHAVAETRRVALCTGGLSLPETGSDGKGIEIARHLGHEIVPTFPALTPLLSDDEYWTSLTGIALETELSFYRNGKKWATAKGALLFTHFGFSGPAALDISRHWAVAGKEASGLFANFLPGWTVEKLLALFEREKTSKMKLKNFLSEHFAFPARFSEVFLDKTGRETGRSFNDLKAVERRKLAADLLNAPLRVTGVYGYKKAEVTAGGVELKDVRVQTMESKKVPGLYFAGEILDMDGRIGGFNFQWAWSSGTLAGRGAAGSLK